VLAVVPPTINNPPAINLLPHHPGLAGAANNLAAGRQLEQQRDCNQRIAGAAMEGVGETIFIDEVDAESMRRPHNHDNVGVIDGMHGAMLQATRMISQAMATARAHPPAAARWPLWLVDCAR
jgi:hypothetical protein